MSSPWARNILATFACTVIAVCVVVEVLAAGGGLR